MFNLITTVTGLSLVAKAKTDIQKIIGAAILSAGLNASVASLNRMYQKGGL